MNCDYMKYNVGDLVILKDKCWVPEYRGIVGTIIELRKYPSSNSQTFLVRFENDFLPRIFKNRYIIISDIFKHYPVVKV